MMGDPSASGGLSGAGGCLIWFYYVSYDIL